jgi:hypothetical protein
MTMVNFIASIYFSSGCLLKTVSETQRATNREIISKAVNQNQNFWFTLHFILLQIKIEHQIEEIQILKRVSSIFTAFWDALV